MSTPTPPTALPAGATSNAIEDLQWCLKIIDEMKPHPGQNLAFVLERAIKQLTPAQPCPPMDAMSDAAWKPEDYLVALANKVRGISCTYADDEKIRDQAAAAILNPPFRADRPVAAEGAIEACARELSKRSDQFVHEITPILRKHLAGTPVAPAGEESDRHEEVIKAQAKAWAPCEGAHESQTAARQYAFGAGARWACNHLSLRTQLDAVTKELRAATMGKCTCNCGKAVLNAWRDSDGYHCLTCLATERDRLAEKLTPAPDVLAAAERLRTWANMNYGAECVADLRTILATNGAHGAR